MPDNANYQIKWQYENLFLLNKKKKNSTRLYYKINYAEIFWKMSVLKNSRKHCSLYLFEMQA